MKRTISAAALTLLVCLGVLASANALAEPVLILNEYNCVGGSKWLDGDDSDKADTRLGRIMGNGDNWIELVVVADHADIRGYELWWLEDDGDGNGNSVWDPTRVGDGESQGKIVFGDAALWSDLRSGTIITISDKQIVNTEDPDGNPVERNLSTDTSYNPFADDWWIHVSSRQEAGLPSSLVTTVNNVAGDPAGAFSVGNDKWELRIVDGTTTVFGPIGEDVADWGGGNINSEEVGKLEVDPSISVTNADFNDGTSSSFGDPNVYGGGTQQQDFTALRSVVPEPASAALLLSALAMAGFFWARRR
ncbi:MAG: PEP-CTERM sorting domain-containing protein [Pirellulales bacterium]|nr:PEP-CTERM sorting domain-containing protein [Pirellulales bacterium]